MGNMCCRRVGYSPNGTEVDNGRCHQQQPQEHQQQKTMSNAYHNTGDDCAINELLEGRMDLDVVLPDGRKVKLTVERRTPMMDLLVQAASATKISPAGHTIHVFGDAGKGSGTLHYKPSTPIGSLDANTICIVPKKEIQDSTTRRAPKIANRPFEPTFRVQVHLPRNQLTVVRVSPRVKISELRSMVCQEKGLDTSRYQLVRPSIPGQPLSGGMTLAEYGSTEITLLSTSCIESHICNSTSHIIPYSKRIEEQKKKKTGILRLLAEDANAKAQRKPLTTQHRSAPTIKVSEATSQGRYKPKKRRPAPPPPTLPEPPFHSRQSSSDSSGYHEATSSYLHEENCPAEKASSDSSGVSSLDAKVPQPSVLNTKKRKAPPPPPAPVVDEKKKTADQVDKSVVGDVIEAEKVNRSEPENQPQISIAVNIPSPAEEPPTTDGIKEVKKVSSCLPETSSVIENGIRNVESNKTKESSPRITKEGEAVTRVALAALNARIEQDVTQQEITSSIQAAFHSLDSPQRIGPSLLAIKQRERPVQNGALPVEDDTHRPPTPPPITEERLIPDDSASHQVYPLQKSSARLSFDAKGDFVDNLETFLPPPSEFRGVENDPIEEEVPPVPCPSPFRSKTLRRSSSLLNLTESSPHRSKQKKVKELQRSLSDLTVDDRGEFEAEQKRLQREYLKLQRQFILWQQQLLSNHAMLREECLVPQYARTLRQSHSLPEGEDYSDESPASCPLVSRSLSYEPTKDRCSTLPRSTINIPPLEFGPIPINNGSSTLRSSKTKNYFKPPQVRISTKNRQRLPPEIRKDGEMDIYDDANILSTILPSFDSLKLISESNDDEADVGSFVLRNGVPTPKTDKILKQPETVKKVPPPVPNKVAIFPKHNSKPPERNGYGIVVNGGVKNVEGDVVKIRDSAKVAEQSNNPPPPPPMPVVQKPKSSNVVKANNVSGPQSNAGKRIITPQVDPREQLMQEIRRFGGRTALRKISLDISSS